MKVMEINSPSELVSNILDKTGFIENPNVYGKYIYVAMEIMSHNKYLLPLMSYLVQYRYTNEQLYRIMYNMPQLPKNRRWAKVPKKNKN